MVWTDSQDYDADEILYTARSLLFDKTNRLMRKIIILFEVYPRLFHSTQSLESAQRRKRLEEQRDGR